MPSGSLPLSALLSQALVAFTIEFDNAAELQMQHRTTRHSQAGGVWLTSMVMWLNCMRYAGLEPGPENWRTDVPPQRTLPALPDGSASRRVSGRQLVSQGAAFLLRGVVGR